MNAFVSNTRLSNGVMASSAEPHAAPKGHPQRARLLVFVSVLGALALGLAYWIGRLEGHVDLKAANQELYDRLHEHERQLAAYSGRVSDQTLRIQKLEALHSIHLAVVAMTQHNFGIARTRIEEATKHLDAIRGPNQVDASTRDALQEVGRRLNAFMPNLSRDIPSQTAELTEIALELDRLF